jgi:hypothetical protein
MMYCFDANCICTQFSKQSDALHLENLAQYV